MEKLKSNKLVGKVMKAWNVYLYGDLIDTVFFVADMNEMDVRCSLIYNDGYDLSIKVKEEKND